MSSKLPDSGKKLNESIARIQSILESKAYLLPLPPPSLTENHSFSHKLLKSPSTLNEVAVENEGDERSEDVDDLIDGLLSLNLGPAKSENAEAEEEEDLSKLPEESLTPDEISDLRRLCNLPRSYSKGVSYHAFLFQLRSINAEIARLTIIDCQ